MKLYTSAGARVTKGAFPTSAIPAADLPKVVSQDLFYTRQYGLSDPKPEGSIKALAIKAGTVLTQKQIDALFDDAVIKTISPASGVATGGTVVTIKGEHFDGVTSVTFGGTAGTALTIVSERELRVTTPAKAAGAVAVAIVDDAGTTTKANGFTFQ